MHNPEVAIKARGWHFLDLHGLSAPVAKIVLLNVGAKHFSLASTSLQLRVVICTDSKQMPTCIFWWHSCNPSSYKCLHCMLIAMRACAKADHVCAFSESCAALEFSTSCIMCQHYVPTSAFTILDGVQRLEYILRHPDLVISADETIPGLEIITGIGKHTWANRTFVLRSSVLEILAAQNLQHHTGINQGVVVVPIPVLQRYLRVQLRKSLISKFLEGASLRYFFVLCGVYGGVSAMHAVPLLLSQY